MTTSYTWVDTGSDSYRNTASDIWRNAADFLEYPTMLFEEVWGLKLGIACIQSYDDALKPLIIIEEYYQDAAQPIVFWELPYNNATVPLKILEERYEDAAQPLLVMYELYNDAAQIITTWEFPYSILNDLLSYIEESYAITDIIIQAVWELPYSLETNNKVQKVWELPYYFLSEAVVINNPTVSIEIDGELIEFLSFNLNASLDQYCISCSVTLASEAEYLKCTYLKDAICTINAQEFNFFIEQRQRQYSNNDTVYSIVLMSGTIKLDAPYSSTLTLTFPNGIYASDLIVQMAAYQNITVDYQILDWFIPNYAISINDETPLEVIRKITQAVGGVMQSKPNGDLLLISKYPLSPTQWETSAPAIVFNPESNVESVTEALKINSGHNAYIITSSGSSSADISLEEEIINNSTKLIRGFRIPFNDGEFPLETSGGSIVSIEKYITPIEEVRPVDEEWEIVEFIDWVGNTSYPIYDIVDYDWIEEDLGAFQISEDGTLTIINQEAVSSESLLRIRYTTKFWMWTVRCTDVKSVQFFIPEEV